MTALGSAARTSRTRRFVRPGRSISLRSNPSLSQLHKIPSIGDSLGKALKYSLVIEPNDQNGRCTECNIFSERCEGLKNDTILPPDALAKATASRIASSSTTNLIAPNLIPPRQVNGVPLATNAELLSRNSKLYTCLALRPLTTARISMVPRPKKDSPWTGSVLRSMTSLPSMKRLPVPAMERPNSQSPSSSGVNFVEYWMRIIR